MINKLKGVITEKAEKRVSLLVANAISFDIQVTDSSKFLIGIESQLYIATLFNSEKGYFFYGFLDAVEKEYFLILQNCHGVGPKIALSILSSITSELIYEAILKENKLIFESIPGIGKKKAEMIVLELKNKMSQLIIPSKSDFSYLHNDFIATLRALGYGEIESNVMAKSVYTLNFDQAPSLAELVKTALSLK